MIYSIKLLLPLLFFIKIGKKIEKSIFLEVRDKNEHAIALYKKVGFNIFL